MRKDNKKAGNLEIVQKGYVDSNSRTSNHIKDLDDITSTLEKFISKTPSPIASRNNSRPNSRPSSAGSSRSLSTTSSYSSVSSIRPSSSKGHR